MNRELSPEATELGSVVRDRLENAGGFEFLRAVVADPTRRAEAGDILDEVGLWDLGPLLDPIELEAAAAASSAAGSFCFPYPVVERLAAGGGARAIALISRAAPRVTSHLDLPFEWRGLDLTGVGYRVAPAGELLRTPAAPFGVPSTAVPEGALGVRDAAVAIALHAWWLLGLLRRAADDTIRYTSERVQFGRTLDKFQAVAFRLADMELAIRSVDEMARYALWSIARGDDERSGLVDALALRVAALEAADTVLRGAHQLHGAMGFTDEVPVSWMWRMSQSVRRLPEDRTRTLGVLGDLVGRAGLGELGRPERVAEPA